MDNAMPSFMEERMVWSMDGLMDKLHGIVHGRTHEVVHGRLHGHAPWMTPRHRLCTAPRTPTTDDAMASFMDQLMAWSMHGSVDDLHDIARGRTHGIVDGRLITSSPWTTVAHRSWTNPWCHPWMASCTPVMDDTIASFTSMDGSMDTRYGRRHGTVRGETHGVVHRRLHRHPSWHRSWTNQW